jgi:hypothetical protein
VSAAAVIVLGYAAAVVTGAWFVFRRVPLTRPAIGVINLRDVGLIVAIIVAAPYFYLALPAWGTAALLSAIVACSIYLTFPRAGSSQVLVGTISAIIVLGDVGAALLAGERSNGLLLVNGAVLALLVVGVASLLVQFGMRARDVAVLAGALAAYDVLASSELMLLGDLMDDASGLPFVPVFGWWGEGEDIAIGLDDLLLAAMFPLAARKAFGRTAGLAGLVASLAAVALVVGLVDRTIVPDWPPMVALGPVIVAQYCWWVSRRGRERPTWEYLRDEPVNRVAHFASIHSAEPEAPPAGPVVPMR